MAEEKRPIENGPDAYKENAGERWEIVKEPFGEAQSKEREVSPEVKEIGEEREAKIEEEKASTEELQKEIEKISQSPQVQRDIKQKAVQIKSLGNEGKLKRLLDLAQERGVAFAIGVAKDLNDPYLLDALHDKIIEKGLYGGKER